MSPLVRALHRFSGSGSFSHIVGCLIRNANFVWTLLLTMNLAGSGNRPAREASMAALPNFLQDEPNPMDVVEAVASMRGWNFERPVDDEINMTIVGSWSDLHVCLNWRDDLESVHLAATFDLRIPDGRREEISRLVSLINEQLFIGHFDLWRQDGVLMFRNGLFLSGGAEILPEQCEALLVSALEACERYYPAFQFVIWAGRNAEEAIEYCLMETRGEA